MGTRNSGTLIEGVGSLFPPGICRLVMCYNHQMLLGFLVASMARNTFSVSVSPPCLFSMDLSFVFSYLVNFRLVIAENFGYIFFSQQPRSFYWYKMPQPNYLRIWTELCEDTIQAQKFMSKDSRMHLLWQVLQPYFEL